MKMYLVSVIVLVFLAGTSCEEKIDIEKEKEAIVAVITQEFAAYNARDLDQQSKFFLQDESIMMQYSGEGSSGVAYGWEDISAGFMRFFEIESTPETNKSELINYKIKVYEKSAWATYDEMWYDSEGEYIWKNTNVKFFEKVNGEWKIVFYSQLQNTALNE